MSRLVSRAEFARLARVSKQAISKACNAGLAPACSHDRIDAAHPAAVAYLKRRGVALARYDGDPPKSKKPRAVAPAAPPAPQKRSKNRKSSPTAPGPKPDEPVPADEPGELDAYAEELDRLVTRYGTARNFRDWLSALKDIETIRKTRLDNEQTEGRLIQRDIVKGHLLGLIDAFARRLLTDAPKTIARRCYANAGSNVAVEESEKMVAELIGSMLEPVKTTAAKLLRDPSP